jgi:hypothetical protein
MVARWVDPSEIARLAVMPNVVVTRGDCHVVQAVDVMPIVTICVLLWNRKIPHWKQTRRKMNLDWKHEHSNKKPG